MVRPRKDESEITTLRIKTATRDRLEKRLVEYIHREGNPRLTFDEALNAFMDDLDAMDEKVNELVGRLQKLQGDVVETVEGKEKKARR